MQRLKSILKNYGRWSPVEEYINRIDAYAESDFSIAIENSKALLESIAKEICKDRGQSFLPEDSPSKLLKLAFGCIGVQSSTIGPQISVSLAAIGHTLGELRNEIGVISHGRTMDELRIKKDHLDTVTREFVLMSTEIIACFLIEYFEWKYPRRITPIANSKTEEFDEFNNYWDDMYGEFVMGDYSYTASEILIAVDNQAYLNEYKAFVESSYE